MKLTTSRQNDLGKNTSRLDDRRPIAISFDAVAHARFGHKFSQIAVASNTPIQRAEDPEALGLPGNPASGMENLSGLSLADASVHSNSPRPAQMQALAYAQGSDIHLGGGQEQHLPHEAWHVVQQNQGRVHPTMQVGTPEQEW